MGHGTWDMGHGTRDTGYTGDTGHGTLDMEHGTRGHVDGKWKCKRRNQVVQAFIAGEVSQVLKSPVFSPVINGIVDCRMMSFAHNSSQK